MGTAELSCASLEKLAADKRFSVVAVVTQPDKPRGRDLKLQPSPVKSLAQKLGLPVLQPAKARDEQFIDQLRALQPDLMVVVAYGQILPQALLDVPKYGCLNVHTSLLPKYRGAAPIQWAIANGEAGTGVTIMKMDAGLDTGPILSQRRTPIAAEDDSQTLHDRLARLGAELLVETIPDFVAGKIQPQPQPDGATYAAKIKKEDGRIDWNMPAQQILNRMRAFTPWPGAFTTLKTSNIQHPTSNTQLLKIWKAGFVWELPDPELHQKMSLKDLGMKPGTIYWMDKNGIAVVCGKDYIVIFELQPEGKRRMTAAEYLAGHPLPLNQRLG